MRRLALIVIALCLTSLCATAKPSTSGVKKVRDLVVYSDSMYYSAFPSVIELNDGHLMVAFRRAPNHQMMGYDRYSGMQFSNRDFIVNAILWLTDSEGLIGLREKSVSLRLLNDKRAHDERLKVQLVSTISPVAILALIGGIVTIIRRKKYARKVES